MRALHDASFAGLARAYDARAAAHAALVAKPEYEADVRRSDLWVAERDGRLLGSAGWLAQPDGTARIRKVFVHPDAARQGVATALVRAAEQRSERNRFVLRAYLDAVPLYRRLGYMDDVPGAMELPGGLSMPVLFMRKG
nr:GNAT family N-acetyltransferase [Roseococcus sp. MDT2-1-1]